MNQKKRSVVSYKNCSGEVLQAIKLKYPAGYSDAIIKVEKPNGDFFHAITVDLEDASYLVKVDVKIDNLTAEDFEKEFGSKNDVDMDVHEFGKEDGEAPEEIASPDNFDE